MAQDDSAARAAIDATNRRFEAAFNAGDPGRAAREVYTENASILPPDLPMVQGRENIAQFWVGAAAQLAVTDVRLSTVALEVHGDVAHEIGKATLTLARWPAGRREVLRVLGPGGRRVALARRHLERRRLTQRAA